MLNLMAKSSKQKEQMQFCSYFVKERTKAIDTLPWVAIKSDYPIVQVSNVDIDLGMTPYFSIHVQQGDGDISVGFDMSDFSVQKYVREW